MLAAEKEPPTLASPDTERAPPTARSPSVLRPLGPTRYSLVSVAALPGPQLRIPSPVTWNRSLASPVKFVRSAVWPALARWNSTLVVVKLGPPVKTGAPEKVGLPLKVGEPVIVPPIAAPLEMFGVPDSTTGPENVGAPVNVPARDPPPVMAGLTTAGAVSVLFAGSGHRSCPRACPQRRVRPLWRPRGTGSRRSPGRSSRGVQGRLWRGTARTYRPRPGLPSTCRRRRRSRPPAPRWRCRSRWPR